MAAVLALDSPLAGQGGHGTEHHMASSCNDGGLTVWRCSSAGSMQQEVQVETDAIVVGLVYKDRYLIAGLLDGRIRLYDGVRACTVETVSSGCGL